MHKQLREPRGCKPLLPMGPGPQEKLRDATSGHCSLRIPQDQNDGISAEEQLADEPVLVHRLRLLLPTVRNLSPHLAYIFKHHVRMAVKRLDACEDLAVIPAIN